LFLEEMGNDEGESRDRRTRFKGASMVVVDYENTRGRGNKVIMREHPGGRSVMNFVLEKDGEEILESQYRSLAE